MLPDPAFNGINQDPNSPLYGLLDSSLPLAANRIIPIEPAPDYSEGMVSIVMDHANGTPYPFAAAVSMPYPNAMTNTGNGIFTNAVLMVEECPIDPSTGLPNEPTSWFWNIRIGEKIQIGNAGQIYTVVGPLAANQNNSNPDLFVNDGPPGQTPQLQRTYIKGRTGQLVGRSVSSTSSSSMARTTTPQDGFVDNLWNAVTFSTLRNAANNNGNSVTDLPSEFESETWLGTLGSLGAGP